MGVKDLWTVLTPYCDRKPISELSGKTVAIDLAGWVCESLNVVDYFVHPRHHLKNLFFRTCYLIWEEVTPVFVLEGTAPKLKSQVIAKRNEIQFRGVKPKEKAPTQSQTNSNQPNPEKGRTRFNHVLKQCETLLKSMGINCVQGPGEAEAYCAFLNKLGLVDGVISQDSDCFAYGALKVYRNFSVSTQGAQAAQGGAVDIYDMTDICQKMDFGQNKIIVMALLCGCDYCPDGVGGIGRDSVLKLFNKYNNHEILHRIRSWRLENAKYTALEMRVDDKTICSNCGHIGRTQSHTKSGCGICRTSKGCDESLWKEERLSLKAELVLRKKALADPNFPSEDIINEFLTEPERPPPMNLKWRQPNIVKFIKQIGHLLQWPEIYCFQKFFPILTRWQVRSGKYFKPNLAVMAYVVPKEIVKKRTHKGVPSLEIVWFDEKGFFKGLIPDAQLDEFEKDHPKGLQELWTTVEPLSMLQEAFPELVEAFLKSKEKPKKPPKKTRQKKEKPLSALDNMQELLNATDEIAKTLEKKAPKKAAKPKKGLQMIDKFFKKKVEEAITLASGTPQKAFDLQTQVQCSTPVTKFLPSDLESDAEDNLDISDIVNGIVRKPNIAGLQTHGGRQLHYESLTHNLSALLNEPPLDDLDVLTEKRNLSRRSSNLMQHLAKRQSLDDSFDILVGQPSRLQRILDKASHLLDSPKLSKNNHDFSSLQEENKENANNRSYFFEQISPGKASANASNDEFEKLMLMNCSMKKINSSESDDCILLDDSNDE